MIDWKKPGQVVDVGFTKNIYSPCFGRSIGDRAKERSHFYTGSWNELSGCHRFRGPSILVSEWG